MGIPFYSNIDLLQNQLLNARLENLSGLPSTGNAGRLLFSTANTKAYLDIGAAFKALATEDYVDSAVSSVAVADGAITNAKLANVPTDTIKGRFSEGTGAPEDLNPAQVRSILNVFSGATANQTDAYLLARGNHTGTDPWSAISDTPTTLAGYGITDAASDTHTHLANQITDLNTVINNQIVAFWDAIAGSDAQVDTVREVLDLIIANTAAVAAAIRRHESNFGDGSATSYSITHGLASLDIIVEVYRNSDNKTVECEVVRTDTNTVTIDVSPAPATDALRVVVKR